MTPEKISARLYHIAAYIDSNKNPDRGIVRKAVLSVVAAITRENRIKRIAQEIHKLAIEQIELDLWDDTDEGQALLKVLDKAIEAKKPDDIEAALQVTKSRVDDFIDVLEDATFEDPKEGSDLDSLYEETVQKKQQNKRNRDIHNAPFVDMDELEEGTDIDISDLDREDEYYKAAASMSTKKLFRIKRSR